VTPGTSAPWTSVAVWVGLDLVEAAARTGRHDEAARHSAQLGASGIGWLSPRLDLRVRAAAAVAASDSDAVALFEQALTVRGTDRWPFERARVELAFGERLLRLRRAGEARGHLAAAYDTFRRLGASPWSTRAAERIRAAGMPMPAEQRPSVPKLNPDDLAIARLAAAGASNREIGRVLRLSPRTVGSRLYRIFPRFGVTSRAALRDALQHEDPRST
jgi:DNA-binding CsgD family transcriptional regulator